MGKYIGSVLSIIIGVVLVVVSVTVLSAIFQEPATLRAATIGTIQTPAGTLTRATLTLSTYPDSMAGEHGAGGGAHPAWVSYGSSTSLWVPAHALVTVTIKNYDTATPLHDPFYAQVRGTEGGVMLVNGKKMAGIDYSLASHTFTIHYFPDSAQPLLDVSVPVMAVPSTAPNLANGYPAPQTISFQFRTGAPGHYIWQCFDPCGTRFDGFGGPMATTGYMAGTLVVG